MTCRTPLEKTLGLFQGPRERHQHSAPPNLDFLQLGLLGQDSFWYRHSLHISKWARVGMAATGRYKFPFFFTSMTY